MSRLIFDENGRLKGIDNKTLEDYRKEEGKKESGRHKKRELKKSDDLSFLKQDKEKFNNIFEYDFWSFNSDEGAIPPLKFSNGKTQENVVREVINLIKSGKKVIFLHGVCGTGKSAIALNIARVLGKTSIVVPLKNLQKQYEQDYTEKKYLIKRDGKKMKIAMITGRENHDSIINPGIDCADPNLPENIKIIDRNYSQILEYYKENPLIEGKSNPELEEIKRISIAPANPYWSPILPAEFEVNMLKDAHKKKYLGINSREYVFYHRKPGCSYYDQYLAYIQADVIIFNSAKYMAELSIGRKPETEVEIIDEGDAFLDNLFEQDELNLTRLYSSLKLLQVAGNSAKEGKKSILELIDLEERNKRALGVNENAVFGLGETKIKEILNVFIKNKELAAEIELDELNYSNKGLEVAKSFESNLEDVYLTYRKHEDNLFVKLVSTNLSGKIKEIIDKNKALVFMSGTLHSEKVIKNILGIDNFEVVEAETLHQGSIEIIKTGKEFDCKYSNFNSNNYSRKDYLEALSLCMEKAKTPVLVHVNAFKDLPSEQEKEELNIFNLMSSEKLLQIQKQDKVGENILMFKQGKTKTLFSTRCSRGMDFPGEMCNSVVFTKYPNPNISDTFWKILQKTHPEYFWDFYKDKARREFLQRIYRAIRSVNDHIYVLSPDIRVLDAVGEMQRGK